MENTITSADLRRARLVAPVAGADIDVIEAETGEVIATVGYIGGIHNLAMLPQYFPEGSLYAVKGGVFSLRSAERGVVIKDPTRNESGANPDYTPRRLSDGEAVLFKMVKGLQNKVLAQDKRARDLERRAERERSLAEQDTSEDDVEVIEDDEPATAAE